MNTISYFAHLHEAEPGAWLVGFYDVPEAITQGDSLEAAIAAAPDALAAALEGYLELGRVFPLRAEVDPANAAPGYHLIDVPVDPAVAARGLLAEAMRARGVSKVGLAKLMDRDEKIARRILAGAGSLELTLEALRAMGVRPALAA